MLDTGIEVDGQMDGAGVAQGGIVETADGEWYAPLFQDHGAVGRVPMLAKVTWENDWPVFSIDPTMDIPVSGQESKSIVVSDEFYNGTEKAPYLNKESRRCGHGGNRGSRGIFSCRGAGSGLRPGDQRGGDGGADRQRRL